jgi:NAD(P) transhydrogenase subunit alpha
MTNVWIPCAERGERRVAATPETVRRMTEADIHVRVDAGAGAQAHFTDDDYREAGAEIGSRPPDGGSADLVLTVNGLPKEKLSEIGRGAVLIGFLDPLRDAERARALAGAGISALAMELIPRITRAQPMDALSSQASLAGYKATVLAAARLDRYFPLLMTAAGTIPPSRVVVMGAGVAGLQAIATAKRLGAVVEVSDIRPAVQEQVESLGGRFIELPMVESGEGEGGYAKAMGEDFLRRQREIVTTHVAEADVVITTALVPGRQAPVLLTCEMVERMRPGAVVVDLAVSQGGNCELARADEEIEHEGVLIIGATNLARDTPHDASVLFARNVYSLAELVLQDGAVQLDLDDEIVAAALLTHEGVVRHGPAAESKEEGVQS